NKRGVISKLKEQDPDIRGVHRIDKNVTGGLLLAKTKFAAGSFSRNLKLGGNTGFKFIRREQQIRKHLREILGKPLKNDVKYGAVGLIQPQNCIGLHSTFIETHVGLTKRQFFIPVLYGTTLWNGSVDKEGQFPKDVKDIILNFNELLTTVMVQPNSEEDLA
ncbi:hypothetical protein WICPIJ_006639, partial [Wickerhamomyces pijperi]